MRSNVGKLFGTDGLRGAVRQFPLDAATVELLGRVLYFLLLDLKLEPEVIVGRDTRDSGPYLLEAICRGFGRCGGKLDDAGIISTPALAFLARKERKCAISITASHNPHPDNGIKIFGPDGYKLSEQTEAEIEPYLLGEKSLTQQSASTGSSESRPMQDYFQEEYCSYLTHEIFPDLKLKGISIALDCANGALYELAPRVMRRLGAKITVFHAQPDGKNINDHCGSLHPEALLKEMSEDHFDCGFTFDGDGDRCLAADRQRIYDGDYILAAAARFLQSRGMLKKNAVVATSMSNLGLERFLNGHGIHLHRVPVGDKNVLEKLQQEDLSLGGEQSGHVIFMNDSFIGDGLLTALQLLRIQTDLRVPLSHLCDGFVEYPQILLNIPVRRKPVLETIPEIREKIESIQKQLNSTGRILVRYSGTEMLARIMIEGTEKTLIEQMAGELGTIIREKLK